MYQYGKFQATLDVEWMLNDKENKKLFEIYCWLQYVYEICVYKEKLGWLLSVLVLTTSTIICFQFNYPETFLKELQNYKRKLFLCPQQK